MQKDHRSLKKKRQSDGNGAGFLEGNRKSYMRICFPGWKIRVQERLTV